MSKEQMLELLVLLQMYYESHREMESLAVSVHMAVFQSVVKEFSEQPANVYLASVQLGHELRRR
jgi:hypothetical protein